MLDIPAALFTLAVKNKQQIIRSFWLIYAVLVIGAVLGQFTLYTSDPLFTTLYYWGILAGRTAIVVLVFVGLPGILRRFKITLRFGSLLMLFRRQLGISVYLLVLYHFMVVRFDATNFLPLRLLLFEWFSFIAFTFLSLMFLTSNDFSVQRLGKWWKRLHMLFYIIVLLVFFHVMLQGWTIWSVTIGILGVMEVLSYLYYFMNRPPPAVVEPQQKVV